MILLILLAVALGVLLPLQAGINAQLRTFLGAPLAATLASFAVGTAVLGMIAAVSRTPLGVGGAAASPWWTWTGGLLGAAYVAGSIVLAPRLGAATLIAAVVAGQMVASLLLDHFGWVGFTVQPVTTARAVGAALVVAGVILIQR